MSHRQLKFIPLIGAIASFTQIWPLVCPADHFPVQASSVRPSFRLLQMNVWSKNHQFERALKYVHETKPDLIAFEELDKSWDSVLSTVLPAYGYLRIPSEHTAEILLFSKFPCRSVRDPIFKASNRQYVVADLDINGHPTTVVVVHLTSPLNSKQFDMQCRECEELVQLVQSLHADLIMVGDMNATSWSYGFRRLISGAALKDSRLGRGVQPTWPTFFPLVYIPIDHVLTSHNLTTVNRSTGPDFGSDHLPVLVELSFAG